MCFDLIVSLLLLYLSQKLCQLKITANFSKAKIESKVNG
jgi:hypothetical protein